MEQSGPTGEQGRFHSVCGLRLEIANYTKRCRGDTCSPQTPGGCYYYYYHYHHHHHHLHHQQQQQQQPQQQQQQQQHDHENAASLLSDDFDICSAKIIIHSPIWYCFLFQTVRCPDELC